jgi:hypothetical protein
MNITIEINGIEYFISKGIVSTKFELNENPDCFIEFTIENTTLLIIDLFKCSSTPGTGRILMYNLFDYLISNNYITLQTKVSLVPGAYIFSVERIKPNQSKLVKYYDKLGFNKRENIDDNGIITLSGIVGRIMWNIQNYNERTIIDPNEENIFYLPGGKKRKSKRRKRIKRNKSKKVKYFAPNKS